MAENKSGLFNNLSSKFKNIREIEDDLKETNIAKEQIENYEKAKNAYAEKVINLEKLNDVEEKAEKLCEKDNKKIKRVKKDIKKLKSKHKSYLIPFTKYGRKYWKLRKRLKRINAKKKLSENLLKDIRHNAKKMEKDVKNAKISLKMSKNALRKIWREHSAAIKARKQNKNIENNQNKKEVKKENTKEIKKEKTNEIPKEEKNNFKKELKENTIFAQSNIDRRIIEKIMQEKKIPGIEKLQTPENFIAYIAWVEDKKDKKQPYKYDLFLKEKNSMEQSKIKVQGKSEFELYEDAGLKMLKEEIDSKDLDGDSSIYAKMAELYNERYIKQQIDENEEKRVATR